MADADLHSLQITIATDDEGNRVSVAMSFYCTESDKPAFPVLGAGELEGHPDDWDTTYWVIDANKGCWFGKLHCMEAVNPRALFEQCTFQELRAIHKVLGKEIYMPEWAEIALQAGWTPPKDWKP